MKTTGSGERSTISVSTRSLLGAFLYLSQGIDVPEAPVTEGFVTVTRDPQGQAFDWHTLTGDIFQVKSSPYKPDNPAVAVPNLDHWFYIEDADLQSKSTFALLLELFNISAESENNAAPTLTLPVGG